MSFFCKPSQRIAIAVLSMAPLLGFGELPPASKNTDTQIEAKSQEQKLLEHYRRATRQLDDLHMQNLYIKNELDSQQQERASLEKQLQDIEITKPGVVPLVLRMLVGLDQFIQMDLPFLSGERQKRLALLNETVVKADVSTAEKFRRIMEAFQIENEYGKTIEAYKANIVLNGEAPRPVNFLRLGRVGLFYQWLDGSQSGYWNIVEKRWEVLPNEYASAIRQGLRIARKESAPDMLVVPVSAPEAAK